MNCEKSEQVRWFAEEVMPHEQDLRAYVRRFSREAEVDDVVQESFLRLLKAKENNGIENVRAYLFRTARNAVYAIFRRPRIFGNLAVDDVPNLTMAQEGPGVAEQVSRAEEMAMLLDSIDSLPPRCREIFILRKLQGVPQKEIANRLGLSEQTVQVQIARGARKCAEFFRCRQ